MQSFHFLFILSTNTLNLKTMKKKALALFLGMLSCLIWTACSNDEITFSQDVIEGDIITQKKASLPNNELLVRGIGLTTTINIHGAKGDCTVTSSNEKVATTEVYNHTPQTVSVTSQGLSASLGIAVITVTDAEGNTASFRVIVEQREVTLSKNGSSFRITGVSPADSTAIAHDIEANNREALFIFTYDSRFQGDIVIKDADQKMLTEGRFVFATPAENENSIPSFQLWDKKMQTILGTYFLYYVPNGKIYLTKNLTQTYLARYPELKRVEFAIQIGSFYY